MAIKYKNEIICQEQWLKGDIYKGVSKLDSATNRSFTDIQNCERSLFMVGTPKQIDLLCCEMIRKDMIQIRDSFERELKPEHLEKYKENNNQVIIL